MLKRIVLITLMLYGKGILFGQNLPAEIAKELKEAKNDSTGLAVLDKVADFYRERNRDSAVFYIRKAIAVAEKNNQLLLKLRFQNLLANQMLSKQQFATGYSLLRGILIDAKKVNSKNSSWLFNRNQSLEDNKNSLLANVHYNLQILMQQTSNWKETFYHLNLTEQYAGYLPAKDRNDLISRVITGKGYAYLRQDKLDSAVWILQSGESNPDFSETFRPFFNMVFGSVYAEKGEYDKAVNYLSKAVFNSKSRNVTTRSAFKLSEVYRFTNRIDSAYYFAKMLLDTLRIFGSANFEVDLGVAYGNMYRCYLAMQKQDSAFKYVQLALKVGDSLTALRLQNFKEFQQLSFAEQKRLEEIEVERKNKTVRWIAYGSVIFAGLVGLIAVILFRNARLRKKTNGILVKQKQALERTLEQLKSTQAQLIQSEKMASLGELTAGIAHEIQNPLNFVNNFSEVSKELIDEVKNERSKLKSERDEGLEEELLEDIAQNLEKINHHGKRADAIVKGMLAHSRTSSGKKELTDLNALAEEYLRLSYHGLKAKDASFSATFHFEPDKNLPKVNVVPQDIGRVLLNLMNNAFYAVQERVKGETADVRGETADVKRVTADVRDAPAHVSPFTSHYQPQVTVTTKNLGDKVEILVQDNGSGIPEAIKDKIFQPFFTTKPTGEGTGLGLSLSYDIVKAHGGELKSETKEGEGTVFFIQLPLNP